MTDQDAERRAIIELLPWHAAGTLDAEDAARVEIPDYGHRLPKEIGSFTQAGVYDEEHEHTSFIQGGGHGGSHPHLVHEFVSAIVEKRQAAVDAATAANWTMTGVCAARIMRFGLLSSLRRWAWTAWISAGFMPRRLAPCTPLGNRNGAYRSNPTQPLGRARIP